MQRARGREARWLECVSDRVLGPRLSALGKVLGFRGGGVPGTKVSQGALWSVGGEETASREIGEQALVVTQEKRAGSWAQGGSRGSAEKGLEGG